MSTLLRFGYRFRLVEILTGAGRFCGFVFRRDKDRGKKLMASVGLYPKVSVRFRSLAQLKDSSVVEQMTVNHRDAGSNPAPTLRFSISS